MIMMMIIVITIIINSKKQKLHTYVQLGSIRVVARKLRIIKLTSTIPRIGIMIDKTKTSYISLIKYCISYFFFQKYR